MSIKFKRKINTKIKLQAVSISEKSYFGKSILLIILSTLVFLAIKDFKILPERLFSDKPTLSNNIVVDSLMLEAMGNEEDADEYKVSDGAVNDTLSSKTINDVEEVDDSFNPTISAEGYSNLKHFYGKLHELEKNKSGKVRIAWFGDSMNDGDFIVQDIRSSLQDKFGGQGVGFVAISSLSAGARGSISHQYSKNWFSQSFVKVKRPIKPFGIDGQVFFAKNKGESYWVKYKAQSQLHSTALYNPTLFYGKSNNEGASINVQIGKNPAEIKELTPDKLLNTLQVSHTITEPLLVTFNHSDSIPLYGFNFDDEVGVHVDNFSIRGNSGLPLSILNPSLMNAFDRELHYDLIVLHYGANVLGYGSLNYNWYDKSMTRVVENLRQCFPNADVLVISTADRAQKNEEGILVTDPAVVPLANAQKNYARKTGSGYINLYNLMGGNGSMAKWVADRQAGKDYTHFTASGSKRISKLIYAEIERGYNKHKENN